MCYKYVLISILFSCNQVCAQINPPITSTDTEIGVDSVIVQFVGSGDVQKSLSEGSEFAANTGAGIIFQRRWKDHLFSDINIDFSINVASTVDTISASYLNGKVNNQRDFGSHILLPSNSGQAVKFGIDSYFNPDKSEWFKVISGFKVDFSGSNRKWQDSIEVKNITAASVRIGVFHDFIPNNMRLENDYAIRLGIAGSYRGVSGDAGFGDSITTVFRNNLLGSTQRNYYGFEIFGELRFKNIILRAGMPFLFAETEVLGLSRAQFVTSISFVGGFPLHINMSKKSKKKKAKGASGS